MEGQGAGENNNNMGHYGGGNNFDPEAEASMAELNEEGYGENIEVDIDFFDDQAQKTTKKSGRHTPEQTRQLKLFFENCPHPTEEQRNQMSQRIGLESKQIKFWFQNRRTQLKTQMERHENVLLREDNNILRNENRAMRAKLSQPICNTCGGPAKLNHSLISDEVRRLRLDNARLKSELSRVTTLSNKFLVKGTTPVARSAMVSAAPRAASSSSSNNGLHEKSVFLDLAVGSMNELIRLAEADEPLWARSFAGARTTLNREEYLRMFPPQIDATATGFQPGGSKETGVVLINSLAAVEILMDTRKWAEAFQCVIARASTANVIFRGTNGNQNGALQLIEAEIRVLSPLVPVRRVKFLRFCKQHAEGVWAVADISVDSAFNDSEGTTPNCRMFPSGCILQDLPNGCCKVTWIEHSEYDESLVPHICKPYLRSGLGFGAKRWLATLQRRFEYFTTLMSPTIPSPDPSARAYLSGKRSMLKLAQRMVNYFCSGICTSSVRGWRTLQVGNDEQEVQVKTRISSMNNPAAEPPGILLSASTSVWLPVSPQMLFNFLRDGQVRSLWDILSRDVPKREILHIPKGQSPENCVSLLCAKATGEARDIMILQETWSDASGSIVVYAPLDMPSVNLVMGGGGSTSVALLPSGFAVLPDAFDLTGIGAAMFDGGSSSSGSLLTLGFQILMNGLPIAKLNQESIETVEGLIDCTIQRIKAALTDS